MLSHHQISALSTHELNRALACARNRRDAFSFGREPQDVRANLRALEVEVCERRWQRRQAREENTVYYHHG